MHKLSLVNSHVKVRIAHHFPPEIKTIVTNAPQNAAGQANASES
jgi:hypothetical protein